MLLRSPSATTTGHPLSVDAGEHVENEPFNLYALTAVNYLKGKKLLKCMKPHIRQSQLHNSVGTRMTPEEAKQISHAAAATGVTVSEWVRRSLLEAADCPPWARLLLGEFLALRSVVVDLQRDLMQGVKPSTERTKAILEVADTRKFALADGRIATLRSAKEAEGK